MGLFSRRRDKEAEVRAAWERLGMETPYEGLASPYPTAAEVAPPAPRKWPKRLVRLFAGLSMLFLLLFAWLAITAPLGKSLEPLERPAIVLEAADGTPIARRGQYKAEPVDITALPEHVGEAFVAIEDRRFYDHVGLDVVGIGRALIANAEAGGVVQGGSTLTQQLAKTSFLSPERSLKRKAQEAIIALWLEAWLSKEEILSRYVSSVYFGEGAWGISAAARTYFSKAPDELTLGEAAMLAGLMKAPSRLAPTTNYAGARARGRLVIAAMKDEGLITDAEWSAARKAEMRPGRAGLPTGSYFADWAYPAAVDQAGPGYGEATVRTTLDAGMQRSAERILRQRLARSSATQGALVAMRPDGRVVAMVGGVDYRASAFNRAVQAKRQPGSAFNLFVYHAALRAGMSPETRVEDTALTIGDWRPENYDGRYAGTISLAEAFARSSNVAAVRVTDEIGVRPVKRAARDLGISTPMADDLTIALGTAETNLLELTAAYAAFANGAGPVEPYGVARGTGDRSVTDRIRRGLRGATRVDERREMLALLRGVVDDGTGTGARVAAPAFGKTGTTSDYRDALFVGFVEDLVVGVWVGNDDASSMNGVTGSNVPADIWQSFVAANSDVVKQAAVERARQVQRVAEREVAREQARARRLDMDIG
ncbi:MAG: PBP1A family penicillin-binding protein, partial [Pacificimonas sp.]